MVHVFEIKFNLSTNFNQKLQIYPRLTQLLKSYNENYSRKVSKVFEKSQIYDYLSMQDDSPFHIVRRAVVSIAISGGLRSSEMRMLTFKDVILKGDVYEITLLRKKQNGEKKTSMFIVPASLAVHITNYIKTLTAVIGEPSGAFVKGTPIKKCSGISKFVDQPMGKNMLYLFGKDVAISLGLDNPEQNTGHCFRRTSATIAADSGATPHQMQRAFGWKSVSTEQKYIDESGSGARKMAEIYSSSSSTVTVSTGEVAASKVYYITGGEHTSFNIYS